jgi:xylulokinase
MPDTILVIDIGLTNCKTVLFHVNGRIAGRSSVVYPTRQPKPGWMVQDPWDWLQAAVAGLQRIENVSPGLLASVVSISVTGHMHSLVALEDDQSQPAPCMILGDQRGTAESEAISAQVGLETLYHITGARMDASMPMAKILWLRENATELYHRTRAFLSCKDWFRHQLTGDLLTDPIDACGSALYDIQRAVWSKELLDLTGVAPGQLPVVVDPCVIAGPLLPSPARVMGLRPGIPVVVGAGDDVEVLGNGLLTPGYALEHLGTTGSILTCSDTLVYDPAMAVEIYPHVMQGMWVLGGSVTTAGAALDWAERVLQVGENSSLEAPNLDSPLIFLPHLAGERCPDWQPLSRAAWLGLSNGDTPSALRQAVLEGIAFSLRTVLERIETLAGPQMAITVSRRELDHPAWSRLRANIYNRPLDVLSTEEPTAMGAMILAVVGTGLMPDIATAVRSVTGTVAKIQPDPDLAEQYIQLCNLYTRASSAMREIWLDWQAKRVQKGVLAGGHP